MQFKAVALASHAFALLIMFGFFRRLIGGPLAALSVCVFAVGVTGWLGLPNGQDANDTWIDMVDLWISPALLGTVWLFDKHLEAGRKRYLIVSIGMLVLALGIKEMAYDIPFLLIWLLAVRGKLKSDWRLLIPFFAICAAMFVFRTAIFHGRGAHYGSNGSWFPRMVMAMFGGEGVTVLMNRNLDGVAVLAGLGMVIAWAQALVSRTKRTVAIALAATAAALFLYWADGALMDIDPYVNGARFLMVGAGESYPSALRTVLPTLGIVLVWASLLRDRLREQWIGYSFAWVMYIPVLSAPILGHALYHAGMGWSVVVASSLASLFLMNPASKNSVAPGSSVS
jgi:hypothetical protein